MGYDFLDRFKKLCYNKKQKSIEEHANETRVDD